MFVTAGSVMREGEVIATISDPSTPGLTVDIVAPEDGLLIGAATNPFTASGMAVGHFLPVSKHISLLEEQIDSNGKFVVCGSDDKPSWREEVDVDEVALEGEWIDGNVDSEWVNSNSNQKNPETYNQYE